MIETAKLPQSHTPPPALEGGPASSHFRIRTFTSFCSSSSSRDGRLLPRFSRRGLLKRQRTSFRDLRQLDEDRVERVQAVHIRENDVEAMGKWERVKRPLQRLFCCSGRAKSSSSAHRDDKTSKAQYRLHSTEITQGSWMMQKLNALKMICCFSGTYDTYITTRASDSWIRTVREGVVTSLNWMFRVHYTMFLLSSAVMYYALVLIFAGILYAGGHMNKRCIITDSKSFGHEGTEIADAFELSWTTFSTVGYGHMHPALRQHEKSLECSFANLVCVIESFVGVMFASFVAAILFGRMTRIQCCAQVKFSDPILVQYGSGVETFRDKVSSSSRETPIADECILFEADEIESVSEDHVDSGICNDPMQNSLSAALINKGNEDDEEAQEQSATIKLPCPVLEFRIANRLHEEVGGEIMDATLEAVASLSADGIYVTDGGVLGNSNNPAPVGLSPSSMSSSGLVPSERKEKAADNIFVSAIESFPKHTLARIAMDENSSTATNRVFSPLHIESSFHPSYKRVWAARHVLNDTSPILSPRARHLVRNNGGAWPGELNTPERVREHICFEQILVGLKGISNISGRQVSALKIYDHVDLVIGFRFVNLLYRGSEGKLKVDIELLNDVREQRGGGGEQLGCPDLVGT